MNARSVPGTTVVIDTPASLRSLRLLRLAVADAAAELQMGIDEVDSARIAVDELSALLLSSGEWERLVVTLNSSDGCLDVAGELREPQGPSRPVSVDRVVSELLEVCVDRYELVDGHSFRFWLSSDRRASIGGA